MMEPDAVWDVLMELAGATEDWRADFVRHAGLNPTDLEYRFGGKLGFGGKARTDGRRWWVDCYPEDKTPERRAIVAAVNARIGGGA